MNKKTVELAYLAGFFDGEGTVFVTKGGTKGNFVLQTSACNISPLPLISLQEAFGGSIMSMNRGKANWRPYYQWQTNSVKAEVALTALLPYLRVKAEQAKLALAFRKVQKRQMRCRKHIGGHGSVRFTDIENEEKQVLREAIHILNTGGTVKSQYKR